MDSEEEENNYSDDETDSLKDHPQKTLAPDLKAWDMFRVIPPEKDRSIDDSDARVNFLMRCVKLVASVVVFVIVLGSGVLAKGTVLFMATQTSKTQNISFCNSRGIDITGQRSFVASVAELDRVAWTWALFFALIIPEIGTFLRSVRICLFKSVKMPLMIDFVVVLVAETLHMIGVGILAFVVFPELDVVKAAMLTNCVCFVPGVLSILAEFDSEKIRVLKVAIDLLALVVQISGFVVWPLVESGREGSFWFIPLALFLISFGWWENFVSTTKACNSQESQTEEGGEPKQSALACMLSFLAGIKKRAKKRRYTTYMFISLWKILIIFAIMLIVWHVNGQYVGNLFNNFNQAFSPHTITIHEVQPLVTTAQVVVSRATPVELNVESWTHAPIWVLLIQALSAHVCYITAKYACRIMVQGVGFALPITITVPMTVSVAVVFCGLKNMDDCYFHNVIPDYLFFRLPPVYNLGEFLSLHHAWIWIIWQASQAWFTWYIWWPKCERMACTEKIFVTPMYSGLLTDQSIALNRNIDDDVEDVLVKDFKPEKVDSVQSEEGFVNRESLESDIFSLGPPSTDKVTRIYACATMWHENRDEMIQMLKSIFRMDEDQSARRNAQQWLQVVDPDYYEFETHIFFDDAYIPKEKCPQGEGPLVNSYVKTLLDTIDVAASQVHNTHVRLRPPKKVPTPYGGKLIWTLPGKTKIVTHLKDKQKIRHKKRWSQVMYMYYLLGHRLMEKRIPAERKEVIAENTYLLALDGDIDFQPNAVQLLVDLMKKNKQLGAACGRIHPIGTGAMVWYQRFEYAVGHWLQKATEHMIGCVLCSPGCFSLFRGKALMDDNVMRKYTTRSEEARHYVQYDQGEDRWLCTLLLQRGHRVEYSAASDSYTHCPESFIEFYNQRRRWVPSTMANILDLLGDYKRTVKANDNLSILYMAYQLFLMVGSVLGPGTIFLMLIGAFVTAFQGQVDQWTSFICNLVPLVIFMIICYFAKENVQLTAAMIISTLYGLVMIAVLIGILIQITEENLLAPSSLFFVIVAGQLIITGLLHPREVFCLPYGIIYYFTVPSMYMLLIVYSLFNLNNVSWGTRDAPVDLTQEQKEAEEREAAEAKKKGGVRGFLDGLRSMSNPSSPDDGAIEFSLGGLFKIMCCTYPKVVDEKQQLMRIADSLEALNHRMNSIERCMDGGLSTAARRRSIGIHRPSVNNDNLGTLTEEIEIQLSESSGSSQLYEEEEPKIERNDLTNPFWMEDKCLKKSCVDFLPADEELFWKELIVKYLKPLDATKEETKKMAQELKALRDKVVFGFFMLNAMFVATLFLIQLNKDMLHIKWPLGRKQTNITFNQVSKEIFIDSEYLELEPIGMVFVLSFGLLLFIQFFAMLFHRFGTLSHILSSTELEWYCTKKVEDITEDALTARNGVKFAKEVQRLQGLGDEQEAKDKKRDSKEHRFTLMDLERNSKKEKQDGSLAMAFEQRYMSMDLNAQAHPMLRRFSMRRGTLEALAHRRTSVLAERRRSMRTAAASNDAGIDGGNTDAARARERRRLESVVSWRDATA